MAKTKALWMTQDIGDGKTLWTRIGTGVENADGSLSLTFAAYPVDGKVHVRDALDMAPGEQAKRNREAFDRDRATRNATAGVKDDLIRDAQFSEGLDAPDRKFAHDKSERESKS